MGKRRADTPAGSCASAGGEGCGLMLLRLARAANRSLACSLEQLGVRSQQFGVIHRLAETGPSSQAELAASLRVHASNLVRVLDELEAAGLLVRRRDPADRRRLLVVLTPSGERLLSKAEAVAELTERELLAPLSSEEREQLRELLGRLTSHACSRGAVARSVAGAAVN